MERMVMLVVLAMMMMVVVGESEGSPVPQSYSQLIKEEAIQKQLKLVQKLIDVVLDLSKCPANLTIVKFDTKDDGKTDKGSEAAAVTSPPEAPAATTSQPSGEAPTDQPEGVTSTSPSEEQEITSTAQPEGAAASTPAPNATISPMEDEADKCNYAGLSKTHTMLLEKNTACLSYGYGLRSEDEKQLILDLHNTFRAKVARGDETRGSPGPQPPAADMRELVWNDELAKVAQAWASQCPDGHDRGKDRLICSDDYFVGQNIHYYWGSDPDPNWKRSVEEWYDEVKDIPGGFIQAFDDLGSSVKIGHYTQLVWAESKEVGCGVVYYEAVLDGIFYPESKTYVCNYGPAGNVIDFPLYIEGPAASQCPDGVSASYPELCA